MYITKLADLIRIVVILSILSIFAGCGGGGGGGSKGSDNGGNSGGEASNTTSSTFSTPEANLSQLSTTLKENDTDGMLKCFSTSDQKKMKATFEAMNQESKNTLSDKIASAQLVEETETTKIYKIQMTDENGDPIDVRFGLILENGSWVIWFM